MAENTKARIKPDNPHLAAQNAPQPTLGKLSADAVTALDALAATMPKTRPRTPPRR